MQSSSLNNTISSPNYEAALHLLEHGADPFRHGVVWMYQPRNIEPPHFRPPMALQHLVDLANGLIDDMPEEEPSNADELPTMIVTPIQMALLIQNIDLVEKLFDLGAKPEPKAIAIYPYREDVRKAKAQILARLAKEPPHAPEVEMDYYPAPEDHVEWTHLACRVIGVLLQDPRKTTRYSEMVEDLDLLRWADYVDVHPALVEPFRSGRKLEPSGWLDIVDRQLLHLKYQCDSLAQEVTNDARQGTFTANGAFVLNVLDDTESALMQARLRITGQPIEHLFLSTEACGRALGTFDPKTARAGRKSQIHEPMPHGTTVDLFKLVLAVRLITTRLKKRCAALRRKI